MGDNTTLNRGAWDLPYRDIKNVYVIEGSDDIAYLMVETHGGLHLMVYADEDLDLVLRAMDVLMEAAGIQGVMAVPREDYDGNY
ncbi:MAG: hypothetical protein LLF90_03820 [Methanomicrobiaceae archaeon]|nr:hypothetical protein [Methanomicrobiaceae archaeon]